MATNPVEAKLNKARGLCELAHDTVQLAPRHPLSEAIEQLRQAIEEIASAVSIAGDSALHANEQLAKAAALADALETFVSDADVSLESLERIAEEFRRETGFLAPGKDEAAAVNSSVTAEQRRAAWNEWSGKRIRARLDAARAALKLAGRLP
jgi:hypothetical protein